MSSQGAHINNGNGARRPATKKEFRQAVLDDPAGVVIEATSAFGDQPDGRITDPHVFPKGTSVNIVGPDPYRDRRWYATLEIVSANPFKAVVT